MIDCFEVVGGWFLRVGFFGCVWCWFLFGLCGSSVGVWFCVSLIFCDLVFWLLGEMLCCFVVVLVGFCFLFWCGWWWLCWALCRGVLWFLVVGGGLCFCGVFVKNKGVLWIVFVMCGYCYLFVWRVLSPSGWLLCVYEVEAIVYAMEGGTEAGGLCVLVEGFYYCLDVGCGAGGQGFGVTGVVLLWCSGIFGGCVGVLVLL